MKKILALALCAAILGVCAAPAWAHEAPGAAQGKTLKAEQNGKVSSRKKKTKKSHRKKRQKKGKSKSGGKGRNGSKA